MGQRGKGELRRAREAVREKRQGEAMTARREREEARQRELAEQEVVNPLRQCRFCGYNTSSRTWWCSRVHEGTYWDRIDNGLALPVTSPDERDAQIGRREEGRCIACAKPDAGGEFCTGRCRGEFEEAERLRQELPLPTVRSCEACGEDITYARADARTCSDTCRRAMNRGVRDG